MPVYGSVLDAILDILSPSDMIAHRAKAPTQPPARSGMGKGLGKKSWVHPHRRPSFSVHFAFTSFPDALDLYDVDECLGDPQSSCLKPYRSSPQIGGITCFDQSHLISVYRRYEVQARSPRY